MRIKSHTVVCVKLLDSTFLRLRPHVAFEILSANPVLLPVSTPIVFECCYPQLIAHFSANRRALFLFIEYINLDKNGPLEHIPLLW